MSRTFGGAFDAEKNLLYARPFNSAVIHFGGTVGDIYISDRDITIGANAHKGVVRRWGDVQTLVDAQEGFLGVSQVELEILNFPAFGAPAKRLTDLFAGIGVEATEVDLFQNFRQVDSATILQELLFSGVIRFARYQERSCLLRIFSLHEKYLDQNIGFALNQTDFPLIDPDDVGKYANEIFGNPKGVPAHAIQAGLQSPLQEAMSPITGYVAVAQDFYDALDPTGTVQIGDEQIAYISKTVTPNPRLTGLTRGANSTPIQSHAKDDNIVQVLTEYIYLVAGHAVQSISNVKVWRNGLGYPLAGGVTIELANTTLVPGKTLALVRISVPPTIKELPTVELSDTQGINDGITVNDGILVVDNIGVSDTIAVGENIGISQANNEGQWQDTGSDETITLPSVPATGSQTLTIVAPTQQKTKSSGSFAKALTFEVVDIDFSGNSDIYLMDGAGTLLFGFNASALRSASFNVVEATFWGLRIHRKNLSGTQSAPSIRVNVKGKTVSYNISTTVSKTGTVSKSGTAAKTGSASKSGSATKSGTVTLTGSTTLLSTTTAEVVLGEFLTCDVEGRKDDASGTYTGTPNALMIRPAQIMRYLLEVALAVPQARVDWLSFQTANGDMPASYRFDAVINRDTANAKQILLKMARQARLIFDWPVNQARVVFRKSTYPAAAKTITQDQVMPGTLEIERSDPDEIINVINLRFVRDWTVGQGIGAFKKIAFVEDTTSKGLYGPKEREERFLFDYVVDETMALDEASYFLANHKNSYRRLFWEGKLDQLEAEVGDVWAMNYKSSISPVEQFDGLDGLQKFLVQAVRHLPGSLKERRAARVGIEMREVS